MIPQVVFDIFLLETEEGVVPSHWCLDQSPAAQSFHSSTVKWYNDQHNNNITLYMKRWSRWKSMLMRLQYAYLLFRFILCISFMWNVYTILFPSCSKICLYFNRIITSNYIMHKKIMDNGSVSHQTLFHFFNFQIHIFEQHSFRHLLICLYQNIWIQIRVMYIKKKIKGIAI